MVTLITLVGIADQRSQFVAERFCWQMEFAIAFDCPAILVSKKKTRNDDGDYWQRDYIVTVLNFRKGADCE